MRRALAFAIGMALSAPGWGADKYLSCDCGTNGDGTAPTCAASGGGAGAWNVNTSVSLSPGDKLTASGTCYGRLAITGGSAGNLIEYAAPDGVTLDSTVSVNGAKTFTANTPPAVYGDGSSWQLVSGEVWKKGSAVEWYLLRENGARLQPRSLYSSSEAAIVAALNRGEWTVRNATTDSLARTIYVRTTSGASPDSASLRANNRQLDGSRGLLSCSGQDYWRITGLWVVQYHHVSTANDAGFDVVDCENWSTENTDGTYAVVSTQNLVGANIDGGANGVIDAKVTQNVSNGLAIEGFSATLTNQVVRGEYTYNGNGPRYNGQNIEWNGDADGIGIGQAGGTVAGLILHRVNSSYNGPRRQTLLNEEEGTLDRGSGVYVGTADAFSLTGLVIRGGMFRNNHRYGLYLGDEAAGWEITSSIIWDTYCNPSFGGNGAVRTAAITSGSPVYVFANNLVVNNVCAGGASFATSYASATWRIQNNVLTGNRRVSEGTWFGQLHLASSAATRAETNNVVYSTDEIALFRFGGTTYTTLAAWQSATSGGTNDLVTDPLFIGGPNPTTAEGFRLDCLKSPLKDSGTWVGQVQDYSGRYFVNVPEIGAFACQGGTDRPSAVSKSAGVSRSAASSRSAANDR